MTNSSVSELQLQAVWADQQAQEILLRAALKSCASKGAEDRQALLARIERETERFASTATDPRWRQSVTAIVRSMMDELSEDVD